MQGCGVGLGVDGVRVGGQSIQIRQIKLRTGSYNRSSKLCSHYYQTITISINYPMILFTEQNPISLQTLYIGIGGLMVS